MKRSAHFLVASTLGVIIFFGEFGCLLAGEPFEMESASASEASESEVTGDGAEEHDFAIDRPQAIRPIQGGLVRIPLKNDPASVSNEPNAIILETCDPDPDEVAVPLNVDESKECHKVHARAIRAEAHSVTKLEADFTWSINDDSVASFTVVQSHPQVSSVSLEAKYDIFSHPNLTEEPKAILTVCATPKGGWKDSSQSELCRSLPVYAVANMEGSWCFSGKTFYPDPGVDCETLKIKQDGRFLTIAENDHGTIYEEQLDFYYDNLEYRTNKSSYAEIEGLIIAGNDVEGTFSAFRLPL